jgi:hypothetical protein
LMTNHHVLICNNVGMCQVMVTDIKMVLPSVGTMTICVGNDVDP